MNGSSLTGLVLKFDKRRTLEYALALAKILKNLSL